MYHQITIDFGRSIKLRDLRKNIYSSFIHAGMEIEIGPNPIWLVIDKPTMCLLLSKAKVYTLWEVYTTYEGVWSPGSALQAQYYVEHIT